MAGDCWADSPPDLLPHCVHTHKNNLHTSHAISSTLANSASDCMHTLIIMSYLPVDKFHTWIARSHPPDIYTH